MKRAILIVDHGSRRAEANALLEAVAERLRARMAAGGTPADVRTAHLEIAPPDVPTAIDECVSDGVDELAIQPFFLAPGRHTTRDLPRIADAARARHPALRIHITDPLGPHEKLVDIVLERIAELGGDGCR